MLHGWHNNGLWNRPIWSWSLPDHNGGMLALIYKSHLVLYNYILLSFYFLPFSLYLCISEDCSCYARKRNWLVPRCWFFIYSSTKSRRRISWYAFCCYIKYLFSFSSCNGTVYFFQSWSCYGNLQKAWEGHGCIGSSYK